jgi:hypothetical protein
VEEAAVGEQFEIVPEPDEYGFVEQRIRLQAEMEPLGDGDQPEQDQDREERGKQEYR